MCPSLGSMQHNAQTSKALCRLTAKVVVHIANLFLFMVCLGMKATEKV